MTFRNLATDEAAALVHGLLTRRSEQAAHDLQAFQQALTIAMQQLESAVGPPAAADAEADLARMVERLAAAADTDKQTAMDEAAAQARAAIEAVRAELRTQTEQAAGLAASLDAAQAEVRTQTEQAAELTASLSAAQAEAEGLRQDLMGVANQIRALNTERSQLLEAAAKADAARIAIEKAHASEASARSRVEHELQTVQDLLSTTKAHSSAVTQQLDVEAAERARLAAALTTADSQIRALDEQKRAMDAEAHVSAARLTWLEGAYTDGERVQKELEARLGAATTNDAPFRAQVEEAERQLQEVRAELDRANEARAKAEQALQHASGDVKTWRSEQAASIRQHAVTFLSRSLNRLRACSDTLSDAFTADEVLAALVTVFSSEFARVALFSVKHNRLEGIRQIGFEGQPDMSQLLIPRTLDSLLTRAAVSGHIEVLAGGELDDASGSPFGGTPGSVWAIPIEVDGVAVAVIYADDSDKPHTEIGNLEVRTKFADLLSRYASSALARLPAAGPEVPDLHEFARRLVLELESMYNADVSMGRKKDELRSRLRENLEYARKTYAERIASEDAAAATLLDEQLAAIAKTSSDFGKDLAKLLKGREAPASADTPKRRVAEGR